MISWKNTPIDNLSKKDLQLALAESVTHLMRGQNNLNSESVIFAFLFGVLASSGMFALIYMTILLAR